MNFNMRNFKLQLNKNKQKGFVLLFAVVLTSIILSIALGLADVSFKELRFGSSARDTGESFFASDTGIECALFYDLKGAETELGDSVSPFGYDGSLGELSTLQCAGQVFQLNEGNFSLEGPWTFTLTGLGLRENACAIVLVDKTTIENTTRIVSKGYNAKKELNCTGDLPNTTEREIELRYSNE